MKTLAKLFITFILIPSSLIGFFYVLDQQGFFNLKKIEIIVESTPNAKPALRKAVERLNQKLEVLRSQSLWKLDLQLISQQISEEKWVESFRISRQWPATLRVVVNPQALSFVYIAQQGDIGSLLNAADEIPRHGVSETRASHQQVEVFCVLSQEHSGLASRVSASHNNRFFATAELRLNKSCTVVNACTFKAR